MLILIRKGEKMDINENLNTTLVNVNLGKNICKKCLEEYLNTTLVNVNPGELICKKGKIGRFKYNSC